MISNKESHTVEADLCVCPGSSHTRKTCNHDVLGNHIGLPLHPGKGDSYGAELAIKGGTWDYIQKPVLLLRGMRAFSFRNIYPLISLKDIGAKIKEVLDAKR